MKVNQQAILDRVKKATNTPSSPLQNGQAKGQPVGSDFESVLKRLQDRQVIVSKHASERLAMRSVAISESELKRIGEAMERAGAKGIKDAVILMDDKILLANVPNKTIVTAAKKEDFKEQLITNINGAIIL